MKKTEQNSILLALENLSDMYKLPKEEVDKLFVEAFEKIFHSEYNPDAELKFNHGEKVLVISVDKIIVKDDEFDEKFWPIEISLSEAKKINPDAKLDDTILANINLDLFEPKIRAKIKGVLTQKIKELRKSKIFSKYKEFIGETIEATVTTNSDKFALLLIKGELGDVSAYMPEKFKNPKIKYKIGQNVSVYVENVLEESKDAQIIVSNASPKLVKRVLEEEVPEIEGGLIEIFAMSRIPGVRTKIAVKSNDENIDAVGSIIGSGGSRITSIIEKLEGEKLDVIRYSEDKNSFIANAFSPSKVISVVSLDPESEKRTVIVPNRHLTLAIGGKGMNARLVVELVKERVDIISIDQAKEKGIEFEWNGNLTPEEVEIIESGQRIQSRGGRSRPSWNNNGGENRSSSPRGFGNNSDFKDLDNDIMSFNENFKNKVEDTNDNFMDVSLNDDVFTDEELNSMMSSFEIDNELSDFAGGDIDMDKINIDDAELEDNE